MMDMMKRDMRDVLEKKMTRIPDSNMSAQMAIERCWLSSEGGFWGGVVKRAICGVGVGGETEGFVEKKIITFITMEKE